MTIDISNPGADAASLMAALRAAAGLEFRGAYVHLTADDTAVNAVAGYDIPWDAAVYDTDNFWSAGSPTRLTIPAGLGITHVDISAALRINNSNVNTYGQLQISHVSGGTQVGIWLSQLSVNATSKFLNSCQIGIPVSDGDYFTMTAVEQSDTSVDIDANSGSADFTFMRLAVRGLDPA